MVFDFSPEASGHNHNDGLNFTLFAQGEELIVDSAGPYAYGSALRANYFNSSAAHNVVLVNGEDRSGAAKFTGHGETPSPWMQAETMLGNTKHTRTITMFNAESIKINDDIESVEDNTYTLLYHLPPKAAIQLEETTVITVGDVTFSMKVSAGEHQIVPKVGEGWVTAYTLEREAAPVLRYELAGSSLMIETQIEVDGVKKMEM